MAATATRKRRRTSSKCPCGCGQAPAATCRLRKVVCVDPACPGLARITREQMVHPGIPTCGCGSAMVPPCLWDRSEYDPDALEEVIAHGGASKASYRKSGWKRAPQCKSCRRILSNPAAQCPGCGYTDGAGFSGIPSRPNGYADLPF